MHKVLEEIEKIGIVPVIKIDDPDRAVPLAKALMAGGIPCAEITFRTAAGEEAIRRISGEVPGILAGAGTVLTTDQADRAIKAGAKFVVSPGLNPRVVAYCLDRGIPVTPGCAGPSDIERALEFGLEVVKFFPAEQSGGLEYIKALAAPYSTLKFMPTGGINQGNIAKYIAFDRILACGGSWMVNADLINRGDFDKIAALCREAVLNMLGFSVLHLGINTENEEQALKAANTFGLLFGFTLKNGNSSVFSSDSVEIMKSPYLGKNGHIGVGTYSVFRAMSHLERRGIEFNPQSLKTDGKGALSAVYLKEEIAGFAVHLVARK